MSNAVAIAHAKKFRSLHFEVCPTWANGACGCAAAGLDPAVSHQHFRFAASSGDPNDTRTPDEWAAACALEARRLVAAQQQPDPGTDLTSLIGSTGT